MTGLTINHYDIFVGYLEVLILPDLLERTISQHCNGEGLELYNTEVIPQNFTPNTLPIKIVWCSLSGNQRNHIAPLQKFRDGNGKNWFIFV